MASRATNVCIYFNTHDHQYNIAATVTRWYQVMVAVSVIITIISLILWLALIGYNASNGENIHVHVYIQYVYFDIYLHMYLYSVLYSIKYYRHVYTHCNSHSMNSWYSGHNYVQTIIIENIRVITRQMLSIVASGYCGSRKNFVTQ